MESFNRNSVTILGRAIVETRRSLQLLIVASILVLSGAAVASDNCEKGLAIQQESLVLSFSDFNYQSAPTRAITLYAYLLPGYVVPENLRLEIDGIQFELKGELIFDTNSELVGYGSRIFKSKGYQNDGLKIQINKGEQFERALLTNMRRQMSPL